MLLRLVASQDCFFFDFLFFCAVVHFIANGKKGCAAASDHDAYLKAVSFVCVAFAFFVV
jgi:hypothetical protein